MVKQPLGALKLCSAALAIISASLTAPVAALEWDLYGKLELQGLYTDQDLYRYADQGWQIEAPFSRLGIKANQALTESVSLIAVYEWQVNGLDQANEDHRLGSRNTYVGFSTTWGELVFGKNDTRFKKSEGKLDLFNETLADMAQLTPGQDRLENIVNYTSPVLQGWQWSATYQTGASDEQAGGYDWVLSYGDASFKQQNYYLAYGQTRDLNALDAERVLAHAKLAEYEGGIWSAGLMWQYSEHLTRQRSGHALLAQLAYQYQHWQGKLQWQRDNSKTRHNEDGTLLSAGLDYQWQKQLTLYALLSRLNFDSAQDNAAAVGFKYLF